MQQAQKVSYIWEQFNSYLCFAEASHAKEALVIVNGHNTRYNRTGYPDLTAIIHKFKEDVSVVEELSYNEISSSVNLKREQHQSGVAPVRTRTYCSIKLSRQKHKENSKESVTFFLR